MSSIGEEENFQARGRREGLRAQDMAEDVLRGAGFHIEERNHGFPQSGVAVNFSATDKRGDHWHFDVSGAFTSDRPGLIRTDTVWKALGRINVLNQLGVERVVILTTNLPIAGSNGDLALRAASATYFDAIEMLTSEGRQRLKQYASGRSDRPLPGVRSVDGAYSVVRRTSTELSERVAVPLTEVRDALPRKPQYDVQLLPYRVVVYLPSKSAAGADLDTALRRRVSDEVKALLGDFAGGCTTTAAVGSWVEPIGGVMNEGVAVVESYASEQFPEQLIEHIVHLVADRLGQHTVAMIVQDTMVQLTPK